MHKINYTGSSKVIRRLCEIVNSVVDALSGKADVEDIPTKTSDLTNDSGFITDTVNNLRYYYTKEETYDVDEVNRLIAGISSTSFEVVETLPETLTPETVYIVGPLGLDQLYALVYARNSAELFGCDAREIDFYLTTDTNLSSFTNLLAVVELPTIDISDTTIYMTEETDSEIWYLVWSIYSNGEWQELFRFAESNTAPPEWFWYEDWLWDSPLTHVAIFPETLPKTTAIYLLPSSDPQQQNVYDEYIFVASLNDYEKIGTTSIDLSNYVTIDEFLETLDQFDVYLSEAMNSFGYELLGESIKLSASHIFNELPHPTPVFKMFAANYNNSSPEYATGFTLMYSKISGASLQVWDLGYVDSNGRDVNIMSITNYSRVDTLPTDSNIDVNTLYLLSPRFNLVGEEEPRVYPLYMYSEHDSEWVVVGGIDRNVYRGCRPSSSLDFGYTDYNGVVPDTTGTYLVPKANPTSQNDRYDEYKLIIESGVTKWELIGGGGGASGDYVTEEELEETLQDYATHDDLDQTLTDYPTWYDFWDTMDSELSNIVQYSELISSAMVVQSLPEIPPIDKVYAYECRYDEHDKLLGFFIGYRYYDRNGITNTYTDGWVWYEDPDVDISSIENFRTVAELPDSNISATTLYLLDDGEYTQHFYMYSDAIDQWVDAGETYVTNPKVGSTLPWDVTEFVYTDVVYDDEFADTAHMYFVPKANPTSQTDKYDEYKLVVSYDEIEDEYTVSWELIGGGSGGGGTGTVTSVNNIQPDINGNVTVPIPTALSELTDDSTHRLMTDAEKTALTTLTTPLIGNTDPQSQDYVSVAQVISAMENNRAIAITHDFTFMGSTSAVVFTSFKLMSANSVLGDAVITMTNQGQTMTMAMTLAGGANGWVGFGPTMIPSTSDIPSVSANPASTSGTLNGIEIDGVGYAIHGGGGSTVRANEGQDVSTPVLKRIQIDDVSYNVQTSCQWPMILSTGEQPANLADFNPTSSTPFLCGLSIASGTSDKVTSFYIVRYRSNVNSLGYTVYGGYIAAVRISTNDFGYDNFYNLYQTLATNLYMYVSSVAPDYTILTENNLALWFDTTDASVYAYLKSSMSPTSSWTVIGNFTEYSQGSMDCFPTESSILLRKSASTTPISRLQSPNQIWLIPRTTNWRTTNHMYDAYICAWQYVNNGSVIVSRMQLECINEIYYEILGGTLAFSSSGTSTITFSRTFSGTPVGLLTTQGSTNRQLRITSISATSMSVYAAGSCTVNWLAFRSIV